MDFLVGLLIFTIWNLKTTSSHPVPKNGNNTLIQPGDFPFHCVIRIRPIIDEDFLLCEGAIIDKKWALTAAGCVDKYKSNPELLEIVAGIVSTENIRKQSHAQVRKVSQIKFSPLWTDSKKKSGDIALLEIKKIFKFNKYVNSATFENNATNNEIFQIIGYGKNDNLTVKNLKKAPSEECLQKNDNPSELFCAKENNIDHAFWDKSFAGAPLVKMNTGSEKEILAIFSAEHLDIFTNLTFHKLWIQNTAKIDQSNAQDTTQSSATSTEGHEKSSDGGGVPDGSNNSTNTIPPAPENEDEDSEEDSSESEENSTERTEESEESVEDNSSEETTETASNTTEEQDETPPEEFSSDEESSTTSSPDESEDETESESEEESSPTPSSDESTDATSASDEESSTTQTPDEGSDSSESNESDESEEKTSTSSPNSTTTSPSSSTSAPPSSTTAPSPTSTSSSPSTTSSPSSTTASPTTTPSSTTSSPAPSTSQSPKTTTTTSTTSTTNSTSTPTSTSTTTPATTTPDDYYYDDDEDDTNTTSSTPSHNQNFDQYDEAQRNSPNFADDTNAVTSNSAQSSNPHLISSLTSKAKSLVSSFKQLKNFFAIL